MSLNREQWAEMWESVKNIEYEANKLDGRGRSKKIILWQVDKIKNLIQSVVGQME